MELIILLQSLLPPTTLCFLLVSPVTFLGLTITVIVTGFTDRSACGTVWGPLNKDYNKDHPHNLFNRFTCTNIFHLFALRLSSWSCRPARGDTLVERFRWKITVLASPSQLSSVGMPLAACTMESSFDWLTFIVNTRVEQGKQHNIACQWSYHRCWSRRWTRWLRHQHKSRISKYLLRQWPISSAGFRAYGRSYGSTTELGRYDRRTMFLRYRKGDCGSHWSTYIKFPSGVTWCCRRLS